jgi:cupin superfamily acireductone dioxygenase involved in methionine salvage
MSRTHEQFLEELRESEIAVERVAAYLRRERHVSVLQHPTFEAPTFEQRRDYADRGDLEILLGVEVKHSQQVFTGKHDHRYRDVGVVVDGCATFDKKRPEPYVYVIVNRDMSRGLWLNVPATKSSWERFTGFAKNNEVDQPFYRCPIGLFSEVIL